MEIIQQKKPSHDLISHFQAHWKNSKLVISGETIDLMDFPVLILLNPSPVGFLSYRLINKQIEILSLISEESGKGIGSILLEEIESIGRSNQYEALTLITTNDNLNALRFYQKRGFQIRALYPDAIPFSRTLKPEIPMENNGIPINDELLLMKKLAPGSDFFYRDEVFHVKPSISLRPFAQAGLDDIISLFSDPKVFRYQAMRPIESPAAAAEYIHRVCHQVHQEKRLVRGIYVNEHFAGIISLHQIRGDRCALGYSLSPEYWKKGIATEAAISMIRIAIDQLQIRRIEAITHPDNIASIRLLERLRFHQEGTLIEYLLNPRTNQYENRETYALLTKNFR